MTRTELYQRTLAAIEDPATPPHIVAILRAWQPSGPHIGRRDKTSGRVRAALVLELKTLLKR